MITAEGTARGCGGAVWRPGTRKTTFVTFHAKTYTNDYRLNGQKLTANGRLTNATLKCSNALPNVSNGRSNISNRLRKRSNGQLKKSHRLSKCSNGQLKIS